jgi:hypothetical protein
MTADRGFRFQRQLRSSSVSKSGDVIAVSIRTQKGELLYHGLANMGSGKEIYRSYVSTRLKKGADIRVTVSRPPKDVVGLIPHED